MERTKAIISGMRFVKSLLGRTSSLARRAALVLGAAQLVLGTAPLLESGARTSRSHVESDGTRLHHAHDAAGCIACAASQLLSGAETAAKAPAPVAGRGSYIAVNTLSLGESVLVGPAAARDPPSVIEV